MCFEQWGWLNKLAGISIYFGVGFVFMAEYVALFSRFIYSQPIRSFLLLRQGFFMSRLELENISKQYPGVKANDRVCLSVQPGEIHAILGENGAGKSTLMKMIYGVIQPDEGQIYWNDSPVAIESPAHARSLGISMVFQHFSLFDTLSTAENVWLGLDKSFSLAEVIKRMERISSMYGLHVEPRRPVHTLSVGERQRVEIVRALLANPQLLILDEPTSVLTPQAVQSLFVTLRQLSSEGCSILYISHKLHEIRELCTACTVLRAGKVVGQVDPRHETNMSLGKLMIGAEPPELVREKAIKDKLRLYVRSLNVPKRDQFGMALKDISFDLHASEIVGIAGVSGNGQQELLRCLSGEDVRTKDVSGAIFFDGAEISRLYPNERRKQGIHFVPEERLGRGAVPSHTLAQNMLLTRTESVSKKVGLIDRDRLVQQAQEIVRDFDVKTPDVYATAKSLSGGNLQKYIMGREITALPEVLIVSQPTWGVDVGAAAQIRNALLALRKSGCAVLVVSEELEELFEICDRLYVISEGQVSPSLNIEDATIEKVGLWMSGLWTEEDYQKHVSSKEGSRLQGKLQDKPIGDDYAAS